MAGVNTLTDQLFADKAPHMLIPDTGDERRIQTKSRASDADIGRAATNIFGEAGHVLETATDLAAI